MSNDPANAERQARHRAKQRKARKNAAIQVHEKQLMKRKDTSGATESWD
jgi:hypothetical protein